MMHRFLVAIGMVLLLGLPRAVVAQERCFPADKTPYCLDATFHAYWEMNGGLPVFGYPMTEKTDELSKDTSLPYPTQWLERYRFEYHAEYQGTQYEMLLGLLGKERLAQVGRNPTLEPREAGPKPGCLWFEQTGHNVCNNDGTRGFKTYWETHGLAHAGMDRFNQSLQLFGLPLTEPQMETNSAGDTVLTQWFERARFEWHPQNPPAYQVLLGLLGKEVRQAMLPGVTVLSHRAIFNPDYQFYDVVGEVINQTTSTVENVQINGYFYDSSNSPIHTPSGVPVNPVTAGPLLMRIKPGEKVPFSLMLSIAPYSFDHAMFIVEGQQTQQPPIDAFTALNIGIRDTSYPGVRSVYGDLRNDTGMVVNEAMMAITCYASDGTVLQVGHQTIVNLAIGQTAHFEVLLRHIEAAADCRVVGQVMNQ